MFFFWHVIWLDDMFAQENKRNLFFLIDALIGQGFFTIHSEINLSACNKLSSSISLMLFITSCYRISLVSNLIRSFSSLWQTNGFPNFSNSLSKTVIVFLEAFLKLRCFFMVMLFFWIIFLRTVMSPNYVTILATLGPQTVHPRSLSSSSVRPTTPPLRRTT